MYIHLLFIYFIIYVFKLHYFYVLFVHLLINYLLYIYKTLRNIKYQFKYQNIQITHSNYIISN